MTEWLYEAGIGEVRAALVVEGRIIEAIIERDEDTLRAGLIAEARLTDVLIPRKRGIVTFTAGKQALIEPMPAGVAEGAMLTIEIVREAIPEQGRQKLARAVASDAAPRPAPSVRERIEASGLPVRVLTPIGPDLLEEAGWSELLDEAARGEIAFPGGALRISLTPAMTLIDVDGDLPPAELARAGAAAAGAAIRRLAITGSIGVDLPTMSSKAERLAAAGALDAALPKPFERTAVNGFGFMQIIRQRARASLPELVQADPVLAAALALLRRAERTPGAGALILTAHPQLVARLEARPEWRRLLAERAGTEVRLLADAGRPISACDARREHP